MSPLDVQVHEWRQRAARYRQFSMLLGEDETAGRLRALALDIERQLENFSEVVGTAEKRRHDNTILLAEIDSFLAQAQSAIFFSNHLLRPLRFSADDLQEESRLCREEAGESSDIAARRALASRALSLAMLGEKIAREKAGRTE